MTETLPAVGQPAPDFNLPRDGGDSVSLADLRGKAVVLYFYPKDDTPGCTIEAIDFTARAGDFAAANAVVLGLSKDSVADHEKFRDKHGLGVALLSDAEGDVAERYGVWGEKTMFGKKSMGITRATVLIDGDGIVRRVWSPVKVENHAQEVLEAVRAL